MLWPPMASCFDLRYSNFDHGHSSHPFSRMVAHVPWVPPWSTTSTTWITCTCENRRNPKATKRWRTAQPIPIESMSGIYANIGGILMGSMLPYIAYMDPMGLCVQSVTGWGHRYPMEDILTEWSMMHKIWHDMTNILVSREEMMVLYFSCCW